MTTATFASHAALAAWRSRAALSELQCLALFGVGRCTLQRIESGEIEPEGDLARRIELALRREQDGGGSNSLPSAQGGEAPKPGLSAVSGARR